MVMELSCCCEPRLVSLHSPVQCQADMLDCSVPFQQVLTQLCIALHRSKQRRLRNLIAFVLPPREVKLTGYIISSFLSLF